jgi:hypothetical protein
MSENSRPVFRNVFVEQDAGLGIAQESRQCGLAIEEREISKILAILLDQVKRVEDRGMRGLLSYHVEAIIHLSETSSVHSDFNFLLKGSDFLREFVH